jgi:hypothetical protein
MVFGTFLIAIFLVIEIEMAKSKSHVHSSWPTPWMSKKGEA